MASKGLASSPRGVLDGLFQGTPVKVRLDVPDTPFSIDQMTALVLFVSEAATNALKRVFRPERGTLFEVTYHAELAMTVDPFTVNV